MGQLDFTSKELPVAGRVTSTVTPQPLPAREGFRGIRELVVQAHPANTDDIWIGNATDQGIVLQAGDSFVIALENPGAMWHRSATGNQTLNFLGRD